MDKLRAVAPGKAMTSRIVVVGSLNADFVVNTQRFPLPGETVVARELKVFGGGKGANQAYGVARLGGKVSMVGQVGNDTQGSFLIQNLSGVGVDVTHISRDADVSTGVAIITINAQGQNQILAISGANGTFSETRIMKSWDLIGSAGILLLQLEVPFQTVVTAARWGKEAGALVILDPAPAQQLSDELLACIDYLTPNESELALLTQTPLSSLSRARATQKASELRARGAKKVILKMGAQGALLLGEGQEHLWPALPVSAVDTTAAGDAFNAGFAFALASGKSELEAGRFATATAACSVTLPGAQSSMPSLEEVELRLRRGN